MNSISLKILILAVLIVSTQQSKDNILLKKLIINNNPSISSSSNDENIFMYRVNDDDSIYILNKLNNKFALKDANLNVQTIKSNDDEISQYVLLYSDSESALIGTRNKLINVSLNDLYDNESLKRSINWSDSLKAKCSQKSNTFYNPFECDNYIRGSVPLLDKTIIITCGTNANQPYCRKYNLNKSKNTFEYNNKKGNLLFTPPLIQIPKTLNINTQNIPPFSYQDSIFFFHSYSQTQDIYKQNFRYVKNEDGLNDVQFSDLIKTPLGAIKNPDFRTSFGYSDKVYFFFSESELSDFNNGVSFKAPYSLVGEICANDDGRNSFSDPTRKFLTFKKAIINCYLPDYKEKFHIKYTEIQEASRPIKISDSGNEVIYAIFTIRRANNVDSALCMYKMSTIEDTMKGLFKSNPLKTSPTKPLDSCDAYKSLNNLQIDNYFKDISKYGKFQIEQSINEKALFALNNVKFTTIAVDSFNFDTQSTENNYFNNIIFLGLSDGRIIKLLNRISPLNGLAQPMIVGEYQMFERYVPINNIMIYHANRNADSLRSNSKKIIAISNGEIKSFPLDATCAKYKSCAECISAQDPYCAWSTSSSKCVYTMNKINDNLINDVLNGDLSICKAYSFNIGTYNSKSSDIKYNINTELNSETNDLNTLKSNVYMDSSVFNDKNKDNSTSSGIIFLIILVTAIITGVFSVYLTWLFVTKRYEMTKRNLLKSSSSSNVSNASSFSFTHYLNNLLRFIQSKRNNQNQNEIINKNDKNLVDQKQKILNCYEPSSNAIVKNGLKPVTVLCRPNSNSESDSPTTTSSLTESNNNSPNNIGNSSQNNGNLLTPYSSINDTLSSSSNDSFENNHHEQEAIIIRSNNNRYHQKDASLGAAKTDAINATTNLLINGKINNSDI